MLEQRTHNRVIVFRPIFPVRGQDLGYLPGSETETMMPWGAAVTYALEAIAGSGVIDEVFGRGLLEVLPLTHIRGRNLTDSFVIIDEAQNLERSVLLTALSRLGQGSRVVLTHDVGPARQPARGSPRRRGLGDRDTEGSPPVRPRLAHPGRAQPGGSTGHAGARRRTRALQAEARVTLADNQLGSRLQGSGVGVPPACDSCRQGGDQWSDADVSSRTPRCCPS